MNQTSRRGFLAASGTGVAAIAVAPAIIGADSASAAPTARGCRRRVRQGRRHRTGGRHARRARGRRHRRGPRRDPRPTPARLTAPRRPQRGDRRLRTLPTLLCVQRRGDSRCLHLSTSPAREVQPMSSHREAPEISKDPVADNTDVYAFVSPDRPSTVTLIANFIPLQNPMGGPNFFEFGDDVLYEIHVNNRGDAKPDVTYQFRFTTKVRNPNTFLYNTGPIANIGDATFNRPQTYSVTRVTRGGGSTLLASGLAVPPVNVGVRSTPNYARFTAQATHALPAAGSSSPASAPTVSSSTSGRSSTSARCARSRTCTSSRRPQHAGGQRLQGLNVHTIAIQVPKTDLTRDGKNPTDVMDAGSVIGVYASASRQKTTVLDATSGQPSGFGPWQQVSRLGNPLFNEVIVPMAGKDQWNALDPWADSAFAQYVPSRSSPASCRCSTRASSRTSRPTPSRGRTWSRSCSRAYRPASSRVPELHRHHAGGPAPAEPRGIAEREPEPARARGRRRRRLPERPAGDRRRRHRRAPGGGRPHPPAGRPVVHPRRSRRAASRTGRRTPTRRTSPTSPTSDTGVAATRPSPAFRRPEPHGRRRTGPLRRRPSSLVRGVTMTLTDQARRARSAPPTSPRTRMRARARSCSTSAVTSGPSSCTCPPPTRAPRSPTGARVRHSRLTTTPTRMPTRTPTRTRMPPTSPSWAAQPATASPTPRSSRSSSPVATSSPFPDETELAVDVTGGAVAELRWPRDRPPGGG